MKCALCKKPIENYNVKFNNLKIDENKNIDICNNCVDKFLKWQQEIFAELFPSKTIKKRFKKEN